MYKLENFVVSEEDMGQKTTDAMDQRQHDCQIVRNCQKADVETQQSVQFVSGGHRIRSIQASFHGASECSNNCSKKP